MERERLERGVCSGRREEAGLGRSSKELAGCCSAQPDQRLSRTDPPPPLVGQQVRQASAGRSVNQPASQLASQPASQDAPLMASQLRLPHAAELRVEKPLGGSQPFAGK